MKLIPEESYLRGLKQLTQVQNLKLRWSTRILNWSLDWLLHSIKSDQLLWLRSAHSISSHLWYIVTSIIILDPKLPIHAISSRYPVERNEYSLQIYRNHQDIMERVRLEIDVTNILEEFFERLMENIDDIKESAKDCKFGI